MHFQLGVADVAVRTFSLEASRMAAWLAVRLMVTLPPRAWRADAVCESAMREKCFDVDCELLNGACWSRSVPCPVRVYIQQLPPVKVFSMCFELYLASGRWQLAACL